VKRTRAPRVVPCFPNWKWWRGKEQVTRKRFHSTRFSTRTERMLLCPLYPKCVRSTLLFRNALARFLWFSSDVPAFSRVCVIPSVVPTALAFDYVLAKVSAFIFPEAHSARRRCSEKNVSLRTFDFTPLMLAFNVLLPHSVAYTTVVPSCCRSNRTVTFILFKTALHCSTTNSLPTTYVPFAPGEVNPSLTLDVPA